MEVGSWKLEVGRWKLGKLEDDTWILFIPLAVMTGKGIGCVDEGGKEEESGAGRSNDEWKHRKGCRVWNVVVVDDFIGEFV